MVSEERPGQGAGAGGVAEPDGRLCGHRTPEGGLALLNYGGSNRARSWKMADAVDSRKRWDTDDRFVGVADASVFAAAVEALAVLARRPGWVSEEPEVHLVPHLRDARVAGLRLLDYQTGDDGVLDVTAEYNPSGNRRDIRRQAWALIAAIAEPTASVREHRDGSTVVFEVITGVPEGSSQFASHGHTLRLTLLPGRSR